MSYKLLQKLVSHLEEYHEEHASDDINEFVVWLNGKLFQAEGSDSAHKNHNEMLIAFQMMHLNKELKKITKPILAQSNLSGIDGYSFLLHLNYDNSFRKMELIEMHNLEAPTGIEIIKRLLNKDLIEEFADADDKRAKRVKITAKGIEELKVIEPQITQVFHQFSEGLALNEKIQLSGILTKLTEH